MLSLKEITQCKDKEVELFDRFSKLSDDEKTRLGICSSAIIDMDTEALKMLSEFVEAELIIKLVQKGEL